MNKSESIKNIGLALCKFQATIGKVSKEANNPFFQSKYASLANILDTIQKPLSDCGLAFAQLPDDDALTTLLIHSESGEWIEASYKMPVAKQNDPQAMGSAITYARRYALGAILGLNIDDDDDGEDDRLAESQDDLEDEVVSRNRKKRQQRRQLRKAAQERTLREIQLLREQNELLMRRVSMVEGNALDHNALRIDEGLEQAKRQAADAEEVLARAVEAGNGDDVKHWWWRRQRPA